jgi:hypothetical protein
MEDKGPKENAHFHVVGNKNKALTWEIIQKRAIQGLGICTLCRDGEETMNHLLVMCLYSK